ncbi:hypothetical protein [Clostridium estertheticum]|uniref:Uncharacterized protein n=2 Tax=Clostridium estertheticum TaxID=238834 RepID=A0A1J0GHG7_9CLOT|nr:hypothetical protein [Clostridium estertheticum]APC40334.1 hypothetical protein A7L45_09790 [Clostridium estertheticum subsp. estertheticum]MBU3174286.1 hypothetical protein [Clostridium estertheticum]MBZ9617849.1 hypothetical protein [Clostridium estertheticum subsp. laramiense]MCB2343281.1 hypothetical protein [Clostridium estertheticum]MPQ31653.1 hypothetical protein [Clostridium estertheticum]
MSQVGFIIIFFSFIISVIIISLLIGKKRNKGAVKVEDANIQGQINELMKRVVSDSTGYKSVPIMTMQSNSSMIRESILNKLLSRAINNSVFNYTQSEKLILIYGNMKMFFVPAYGDDYTKEIKANLTRITQVGVGDLRKVKVNTSGSSIKLVYRHRKKILFCTLKQFYFPGASSISEREEFADFIRSFKNSVSN